MAIIKMNKIYDNIYLSDKNLSLGAKGLLDFLFMINDNFNGNIEDLSKYSNDNINNIVKYIKELEDNNYLIISTEKLNNEIIYNYTIYHNRWKMI